MLTLNLSPFIREAMSSSSPVETDDPAQASRPWLAAARLSRGRCLSSRQALPIRR